MSRYELHLRLRYEVCGTVDRNREVTRPRHDDAVLAEVAMRIAMRSGQEKAPNLFHGFRDVLNNHKHFSILTSVIS